MIYSRMRILPYLLCILLTDNQAWSMELLVASEDATLTTAFFSAAVSANLTKLQQLLENPKVDIRKTNACGNTALHMVACGQQDSSADCVDLLTNSKASVNAQNNNGDTPLHVAVRSRASLKTISKLVKKGACPNVLSGSKRTPLHLAITHWNAAVGKLLALGADPNQPSGIEGSMPLCIAFRRQHGHVPDIADNVIQDLLEAGARIDRIELYDLKCQTHLHVLRYVYAPFISAIEDNDNATVKRYLDQGACRYLDFDALSRTAQHSLGDIHNAKYPLNIATNCQNPHPEMVCFLIDAGALEIVGHNLVRNAFTYGHLEMARLLISHIPHTRIIKQWNKVALALLVCLNRLPQQLPGDARRLLCLYCVRVSCIAEQTENCRALFTTKHFEFERLGSSETERNSAYEHAYTDISRNGPTWQKQIENAILKRPIPKKIDSKIEEAK